MANEPKALAEHDERGTATAASAAGAVRLDDKVLATMAAGISNFRDITHDAHTATNYEHDMTLWEALRLYPKAIAFSMILSVSLVMEGYDTALLGGFFAYPAFRRKFGEPVHNGSNTYQLTASWQSGLQAMVQVGEIVGLYLAGTLAEKYGYRKTLLGSLAFIILVIFIMFFAQNIGMLMAGEFLGGLPWGAWQTLTTTYAAEIAPIALRPYLTTFVNMCVSPDATNKMERSFPGHGLLNFK